MSAGKRDAKEAIILEANDNDVLLGRGNAVNFRGGNVRFRQLAQTKALRYATCSNKLEKDRIAASILSEIKSMGGRFLRPISARNDRGEHLSAWEPVDEEVALTKAKQTLRDCAAAIRKETALRSSSDSPPSYESPSVFQSAISGTLHRQQAAGYGANNGLSGNGSSSSSAFQDSSVLAMSLQRSMLEQLASRPMMNNLAAAPANASNSNANIIAAARAALSSSDRLHFGLPNQLLLDDQQSRLLQAIRQQQQQQLSDWEGTAEGTNSGHRSAFHYPNSSISNALSDVQRARERMLIEQYQREQAIAEAQQRMIWSQLSDHARARYEASFLVPSAAAVNQADASLRQQLQRLQSLQHGLDRPVSSSDTSLAATAASLQQQDALSRLLMMQRQNPFDRPLERTNTTSAAAAPPISTVTKAVTTTAESATLERKPSISSDEGTGGGEGRSSSTVGVGKTSSRRQRSPSSSSQSTTRSPDKKPRIGSNQNDDDTDA